MNTEEILKFCLENGLLVDREVLNLFSETSDIESIKLIINKIKNQTNQKILTKSTFDENRDKVNEIFLERPEEKRKNLENLKIKLGLSIEISKEISTELIKESNLEKERSVLLRTPSKVLGKKLEVKDFISYFRKRFLRVRNILQQRSELKNLVSINKISGNRQGISLIGMISDKRVTKNKNIIFEIEDLTGKIKVLVNKNKQELYERAEEIPLDAVIGFKGSGSREIFFVNDLFYPDCVLPERKKAEKEEYALFIGDLHFGSKRFLEESFLKFIDYLNGKVSNTPEVEKIKYLFIVGDIVTGVGNYPNQEQDLEIKDLEEQFSKLANLLSKIRRDIQIILCPGNHDGVRLMEPQPLLDEKYAWPLYNLKNVVLTTNPCQVNIGKTQNFSGFDILLYHGFSFPSYANDIPSLIQKKAMDSPEEIMKYLLKHRHLAPTHSSVQYFPSQEKDLLFVDSIPDIFVSGHTHKSGITYYNNVLVVSVSCWEEMTPYQEKFGNTPDHCKVPMFNLKTRAIKILDFE